MSLGETATARRVNAVAAGELVEDLRRGTGGFREERQAETAVRELKGR